MARRSHNRKTAIIILIFVLIIACVYAAYQINKYWFEPRTIVVKHYLYVDIIANKNYTLAQVLGYRGDSSLTYTILPTGSIHFYTLTPGWNFTREIEVSNVWRTPVEMKAGAVGDIAPMLTIEPSETTLGPKESKVLNLTVHVPMTGVETKQYRGNLTITLTPKE